MPSTEIQWFPGHMAKTRRMIRECLQLVDLVIEILDARIPYSSKNPEISSLCENKPILTVFNKSSLSDPAVNDRWVSHYRKNGGNPLFIDCKTGVGLNRIEPEIRTVLQEKIRRYENKGMSGKRLKAMVVGIPNVGKSTFINCLAGRVKAKAEDRPGVTVTKQWVTTSAGMDLLDMPGVLWPKFEDRLVGENLAATGAIKDQILDTEAIAVALCGRLFAVAPDKLCARYKLEREALEGLESWQIFELIGKRRGFLMSGGIVNTERTALMLLDEFRSAKIGQISLETPEILETNSI
ncbi:MAG: ribosome biogenesis GTPase YlqF [Clostridiales bacterium]|nr:ribosome biogenesis GTPase YlqF [Clostridiales bacterium]HCH67751.1 ribosome biogenesis GTPase YlqF [Clostridiales bacterium]